MLLVNLSNLAWVPKRMKRNQAIFHHLLGTGTFEAGVYVHPPVVRNISTKQDWRLPYPEKVDNIIVGGARVSILQPVFTLPLTWRKPVMDASAAMIARSLNRAVIRDRPYLLWMNSIEPMAAAIAEQLGHNAAIRIFDSSDDLVEFETGGVRRARLEASLARVLKVADRVLCVNEHVMEKLNHPDKRVFHNCTDFDNFQRVRSDWTLPPHFPKPPGTRYIGFVGGLNRVRVDLDLLQLLFERFPQFRFLFVGYTNDPAIRVWLEKFPNAAFVPEVPYDTLPSVIRSFDVAIVPHLDNENTRGNDLLKVLDYFACGVPVVTTRCSNIDKYAGACWIAETHEDFVSRIAQLTDGSLRHDSEPGRQIARERTWQAQVPRLLPWLHR
jgi:glycosyltransferase involved in cell wall biosynthesis